MIYSFSAYGFAFEYNGLSSHKGKRFCWQICIFSVYSAWMTNLHKNKGNTLGGGGTRYNGPYTEAPSERGTFYRLQ